MSLKFYNFNSIIIESKFNFFAFFCEWFTKKIYKNKPINKKIKTIKMKEFHLFLKFYYETTSNSSFI